MTAAPGACSTRWQPSGRRRNAEVTGFLDQMAAGSRARAEAAAAAEPLAALRSRCEGLPPTRPLARAGGFDLIAELKLRSPALGELGSAGDDLAGRVTGYARAGAAAVSVLTEPSRFSGSLGHLRAAASALAPLGVPAMRKDFLVDPYQLYEARAAGAGGALLIVRMLPRSVLGEMLDCARELGLFVLIETFDEQDVAIAIDTLADRGGGARTTGGSLRRDYPVFGASKDPPGAESPAMHATADVLLGVNSRDLQTLAVVPERLEQLAPCLPPDYPRVAESGLTTPEDAARMVRAGYDMALVGGALMSAPDPGALVAAMLAAGRGSVA
jgi:indole-3-glycerol phosphate synthase